MLKRVDVIVVRKKYLENLVVVWACVEGFLKGLFRANPTKF